MSNNNLSLKLIPRKDVDGRVFYVGKVKFPGTIDCSNGVVFLAFISDEGDEQLQIALMDKKNGKED